MHGNTNSFIVSISHVAYIIILTLTVTKTAAELHVIARVQREQYDNKDCNKTCCSPLLSSFCQRFSCKIKTNIQRFRAVQFCSVKKSVNARPARSLPWRRKSQQPANFSYTELHDANFELVVQSFCTSYIS